MAHGPEFAAVLIVCVTLAAGAALRGIARRSHVPYTIAMLLFGLLSGLLLKAVEGEGLLRLLDAGSSVSPALIIFVFLPALIFESASSLDVHAFRRNLGAIVVLAMPAVALSTGASAALMVGLTSGAGWAWGWPAALVFGALISATDPVAVVALLRDLGAPARLGILIEGESLLNDGTAIVLFTVLLGVLAGGGALDLSATASRFVWVVAGGVGVGVVLGWLCTASLARIFNDPTVEITLTLVLAYAAMIVAEGQLHVSGVIALVAAGLWIAGPGKIQISPETVRSLHHFWEMLSYLANTLIFYLVGLVIATQVDAAELRDLSVVPPTFVGLIAIRLGATFLFRPLINRVGDPVTPAQATLIAWAGLRGAVSLALALVVNQQAAIPEALRHQLLLVTAGVVLLTILVNGMSTGVVLRKLGLDRPPLAAELAQLCARQSVVADVKARVAELASSRTLPAVSWAEVDAELSARAADLERQVAATREGLRGADEATRAAGWWQQALSIERQAYWAAFDRGTLSGRAAQIMDGLVQAQLDRLAHGQAEPPASRTPRLRGPRAWLVGWARALGRPFGRLQFDQLCLAYDLSRAESLAARRVLARQHEIEGVGPAVREEIHRTYERYHREARARLEDLRANLPEVATAIETRLAQRVQLNLEREGYRRLAGQGVVSGKAGQQAIAAVEARMKRLHFAATRVALGETAEICRAEPLFASLDEAGLEELARATVEQVLTPGEVLFEAGSHGDCLFVVVRGAVELLEPDATGEQRVAIVLGGGDVVGVRSVLTGAPRAATARATTSATLGRIERGALEALIARFPALGEGLRALREQAERRA